MFEPQCGSDLFYWLSVNRDEELGPVSQQTLAHTEEWADIMIDSYKPISKDTGGRSDFLGTVNALVIVRRRAKECGLVDLSNKIDERIQACRGMIKNSTGWWCLWRDSKEEPYTWIVPGIACGEINDGSEYPVCDAAMWAWLTGYLAPVDVQFVKSAVVNDIGSWRLAFKNMANELFGSRVNNAFDLPIALRTHKVSMSMVTPYGDLVVGYVDGGLSLSFDGDTVTELWGDKDEISFSAHLLDDVLVVRYKKIVPDEGVLFHVMCEALQETDDAPAVMKEITKLLSPGAIPYEAAKKDWFWMSHVLVIRDLIELMELDASEIDSNMEKIKDTVKEIPLVEFYDMELANLHGKSGWWTR